VIARRHGSAGAIWDRTSSLIGASSASVLCQEYWAEVGLLCLKCLEAQVPQHLQDH
jgi:hypothetical protein